MNLVDPGFDPYSWCVVLIGGVGGIVASMVGLSLSIEAMKIIMRYAKQAITAR